MLNPQQTINCAGKLFDLSEPVVVGILNVTPDSFYDGGKYQEERAAVQRVGEMLNEGAAIIDIGALSSRPGSKEVSEIEEWSRLEKVLPGLIHNFPDNIFSIDTFRSGIARKCAGLGVQIINDISGGNFDKEIWQIAVEYNMPYILMHMKGMPADMQEAPFYEDVVLDILDFFIKKVGELRKAGVNDIIIDPGFGFGKTIEHNYIILKNLHAFNILDLPLMVGISRKSMVYKLLDIDKSGALLPTTALHLQALLQGARLIRTHDVSAAVQMIHLWKQLK